jgi:hypothetical protein
LLGVLDRPAELTISFRLLTRPNQTERSFWPRTHIALNNRRQMAHLPRGTAEGNGTENSLFLVDNSLFLKIFSLLSSVGNCTRSRCGTATSCSKKAALGSKIAKFPVKFPVSREFAWRRVRTALRRQPGSHSTQDSSARNPESARQMRPFANLSSVSILQNSTICERNRRKSLANT